MLFSTEPSSSYRTNSFIFATLQVCHCSIWVADKCSIIERKVANWTATEVNNVSVIHTLFSDYLHCFSDQHWSTLQLDEIIPDLNEIDWVCQKFQAAEELPVNFLLSLGCVQFCPF